MAIADAILGASIAKADASGKYVPMGLTHHSMQLIAEDRVNPSNAAPLYGQSNSSRMSVIPTVTSSHIVLAFANITNANGLGEWGGDCVVKVYAALEYLSGSGITSETGQRVIATFNGLKHGEMAPGAILFSDPIPFDAVAGTQFFVRTNMQTQGSNLAVPAGYSLQGGTGPGGLGNGDGQQTYAAVENGTIGATSISSQTTVGPVAILGYASKRTPTAAILGDSINAGIGDGGFGRNDGGYLVRALTGQTAAKYVFPTTPLIPFVRCAHPGETLNQFLNQASSLGSAPTFSAVRSKLADLASTVLFAYGTNDLGGTLATIQSQYIQAANSFLRRGKTFVACTLLPKTTTTDSWTTTANQTVSANEATRTAFNTWLRNGTFAAATISPKNCAVFDAAAAVEVNSAGVLTLNGGLWKPSTGSPADSGSITSGSTTSSWNDTTKAWTQDQWRGYVLRITSGANSGALQTILSNTATSINTGAFSSTPATGDTYQILQTHTVDGTHPSSYGHAAIAATFNTGLVK